MNVRDRENGDLISDDASDRKCIVLAGDLCPIKRTEKAILAGKAAEMVTSISRMLKEADLTIVNLEAPLTRMESGIRKTGPNLRGCLKSAEACRRD